MTIGNLVPWGWGRKRLGAKHEDDPFYSLQRRMNSLFDEFFEGGPLAALSKGGFVPKLDVAEDGEKITVHAELPGMDDKDVQLSLTPDALVITGKREKKTEKQEGESRYEEISYGSFERVVPLSCKVEEDKVDASYKKGVLTVILPKSQEAKKETRKISIRS